MAIRSILEAVKRKARDRVFLYSFEYEVNQTFHIANAYVLATDEQLAQSRLERYLGRQGLRFVQWIDACEVLELVNLDEHLRHRQPNSWQRIPRAHQLPACGETVFLITGK